MVTIYSASAGTGKTHTLTGEYLTLLFKGTEEYRHILAVTFTNKATAEMKSRIIEELSRLADDNQSSDYLAMLSASAKKDEKAIRKQARKILINILHDYSAFNISTIDHFFQRTIRSFTREIGLQGNYQIELDHQRMLEDSVDGMMSELEESKDSLLMDWLLRFIEEKIDRGKDWDIKDDIISLGNQLFKEGFKSGGEALAESLSRKPFLKEYQDELYKIIRPIENLARELGERGLRLMERHGLQASDFKNGSRSAFYRFEKLAAGDMEPPSATFCGLLNDVENYYTKKASPEVRQACENIYSDGMNSLIQSVLDFFDNLTDYYTAKVIARNFYALGILADLSEHISVWRSENNKMHISDSTELLNKIIGGSDVPFIYEKTGTRIDHYMIDEFQDTSALQWDNFRPLIKDSLDSGRSNLIVGDVKQSIYRFRNSDWSLLDRKVKADFAGLTVEKQLSENWRSCRNIVNFNNMIFDSVPYILQLQYNDELEQSSLNEVEREALSTGITSAYKGATQKVAPPFRDREGHVRIEFLTDEKEHPWKEQSLERLPLLVEELQAKGYELRDIAILVRTNDEGVLAAETLLGYSEQHPDSRYRYDIITEDSLTVNSSISVRWIVAMLRYIEASPNPTSAKGGKDVDNNLYTAQMIYALLKRKKMQGANASVNSLVRPFETDKLAELKKMSSLSLYELTESIVRLYEDDFPDNELVFIQAFIDIVAEQGSKDLADIGRFLDWWADEGARKERIKTPDTQNAIRIMSIHKSKGLGFKAVIIPFAEWKLEPRDETLWCKPSRPPFSRMYITPVRYDKDLRNTIFAADYFKEKLLSYIDNLNVMYVAFTRAKEELIVMSPQPKTAGITVAGLLWKGCFLNVEVTGKIDASSDSENGVYETGAEWNPRPSDSSTAQVSGNELYTELQTERYYSVSPEGRLQLRLHSDKISHDLQI